MSTPSQPRSLRVHLYRFWRSAHDTLPPPEVLRQMRQECRRYVADLEGQGES